MMFLKVPLHLPNILGRCLKINFNLSDRSQEYHVVPNDYVVEKYFLKVFNYDFKELISVLLDSLGNIH